MDTYSSRGQPCLDLGYHAIPIVWANKRPGYIANDGTEVDLMGWQRYCKAPPMPSEAALWSRLQAGVGIACGGVVGIDIDILDQGIADRAELHVLQVVGCERAPVRIGRPPKRLMLFRTDDDIPSTGMKTILNGEDAGLDILSRGRQFVAYGVHMVTGRPYEWRDGEPAATPVSELPLITLEQVKQISEAIGEMIGISREEVRSRASGVVPMPTRTDNPEMDALAWFMERLPNDAACGWDDWVRIAFAVFECTGGSELGYQMFDSWSSRSERYDPHATRKKWESIHRSGTRGSVGFGTIVKFAGQCGISAPPEIRFHAEDKVGCGVAVNWAAVVSDHESRSLPPSAVIPSDVASRIPVQHLLGHYIHNLRLNPDYAKSLVAQVHGDGGDLGDLYLGQKSKEAAALITAAAQEVAGKPMGIALGVAQEITNDHLARYLDFALADVEADEEDAFVECQGLSVRLTPRSKPVPPVALRSAPPGVMSSMADWITRTAPQRIPEFATCAAAMLVSTIIGRAVRSSTDIRPTIYMLHVAPSSSGKNHAINCVSKVLSKCGILKRHMLGSTATSSAALRNAYSRAAGESPAQGGESFDAGNGTSMSKLLMTDEIGQFWQANANKGNVHAAALMGDLMSLYSAAGTIWMGSAKAGEDAPQIPYPHLNIMGATTPASLFRDMTADDLKAGHINRFLIIESDGGQARSDADLMKFYEGATDNSVPHDVVVSVAALSSWASATVKGVAGPWTDYAKTIGMSDEAKSFVMRVHRLQEECARACAASGATYEPFGRMVENTIRLAMVCAVSRLTERLAQGPDGAMICAPQGEIVMRLVDLEWAFDIVRYSAERFAHVLVNDVRDRADNPVLDRVLRAVDKAGPAGIGRSSLLRKTKLTSNAVNSALQSLVEGGELVQLDKKPSGKGRSKAHYFSSKHVRRALEDGVIKPDDLAAEMRGAILEQTGVA